MVASELEDAVEGPADTASAIAFCKKSLVTVPANDGSIPSKHAVNGKVMSHVLLPQAVGTLRVCMEIRDGELVLKAASERCRRHWLTDAGDVAPNWELRGPATNQKPQGREKDSYNVGVQHSHAPKDKDVRDTLTLTAMDGSSADLATCGSSLPGTKSGSRPGFPCLLRNTI
jgi:hypothetical protein